jgi:hypothetical protein
MMTDASEQGYNDNSNRRKSFPPQITRCFG